jgi:hypothetical protein
MAQICGSTLLIQFQGLSGLPSFTGKIAECKKGTRFSQKCVVVPGYVANHVSNYISNKVNKQLNA